MHVLKISLFFVLALVVKAEKKIELQDIEEDNLKSEKNKDTETTDSRSQGQVPAPIPLDALKSGFLRYFPNPAAAQQPRYIQQYDVTEPPIEEPRHQTLAGYVSKGPVQIYLVPQYQNGAPESARYQHTVPHYSPSAASNVAAYQTAPEVRQQQTNYIEVPTYVRPTEKTIIQQQNSIPIAYFSYTSQPTNNHRAHPTTAPVVYQSPVDNYQTPVQHHGPNQEYLEHNYQNEQYTDTNAVEEVEEQSTHHYHHPTHTQVIYHKTPKSEDTRLYTSVAPSRNDYHYKQAVGVPNQVIYKTPVQQIPYIPQASPLHRPPTKPYTSGEPFVSHAFARRPPEPYGPPFKRRPTSLLDSYIPSSVQIEYMKRGLAREPQEAYEALSSGRYLQPVDFRHIEQGFLPNQMYHTAAGGVTFGHYKRSPK